MVDVDRRTPPSFSSGLRRLSARASTITSTTTTPRSAAAGPHSFATLAASLLSTLTDVPLSPGLSEPELARIEAQFSFSFPPDLRSLLSLALPSPKASGFPDWRSTSSLPSLFRLPTTSFLLHLTTANSTAWPAAWGPRPADSERAVSVARRKLRQAPVLVPLFGRCYIPSRPSLAGNPVFYVDDARIFCCALNLQDFFSQGPELDRVPAPIDKSPRWVEFWTEAASLDRRRRSRSRSVDWSSGRLSSCSSVDSGPDPERYVEIRNPRGSPEWVERYMEGISAALREGGWREEEVEEMVHVSGACWMGGYEEGAAVVRDVMAMRAERWGEEMRRAGWSPEEVADSLGLGLGNRKGRSEGSRREVKLPPEIQTKVEKLAEALFRH